MSRRRFTLYFISLLALGLAGVWLNFHNPRELTGRAVAGLVLIFAAVVGFVVVFRRELRTTEAEERAEWAKVRPQGRRGFVRSQVLGSLPPLLLFPLVITSGSYYPGRPLGEQLQDLGYLLWLAPGVVALVALWSLAWWNWQEKKYAGDL